MKTVVRVGLLGFGIVGGGTYQVLERNARVIARRLGKTVQVVAVAVKTTDLDQIRSQLPEQVELTDQPLRVVEHPDVDVVVELMGGIEPAKQLILRAIALKKPVVTANKALLATHGNELFQAAENMGVMIGFEAAVAGGIPIIKALREGLVANQIQWVAGIINGTSNFILSQMRQNGSSFEGALAEAQQLGYAEKDPTFDIEGIDAAHKLTLLSSLAFGIPIQFARAYTEGITQLTQKDIGYAEELGYRIKLLGITRRTERGIELRVHPTLIPENCLIANVEGVMNAILVKGDAVGSTLYYGAGAGAEPTGSAVVADIIEMGRFLDAPLDCRAPSLAFASQGVRSETIMPVGDIETSYYLRLAALDEPGVLSDVTHILAQQGISIDAVIQKPTPSEGSVVDVILLTHRTREMNLNQALEKIEGLRSIISPIIRIRLETLDN